MAVKCLNDVQKRTIAHLYRVKALNQKNLARQYEVSERTINRVLTEAGLATPVARIKGEAYHVMKLLEKYHLNLQTLTMMLERKHGKAA